MLFIMGKITAMEKFKQYLTFVLIYLCEYNIHKYNDSIIYFVEEQ